LEEIHDLARKQYNTKSKHQKQTNQYFRDHIVSLILKKKEIDKQIEQLEQVGIISPSDNSWNAPLLVVPKKTDALGIQKYRVIIDFRKLNEITVGDAFPMPDISTILDQLGKAKYFSCLDMASGYHQIVLKPEDKHKTAFSTEKGHFEFNRM
jgi:hypothetical protein